MEAEIRGYQNQELVTDALAETIGALLQQGVTTKGAASLAVSGGKTPVPLFKRLSQEDIAWQNVTVTLVDERWVDVQSPDSNEHLVRKHLLQNRAKAAPFIGLKNNSSSAFAAETECSRRLAAIVRPFDALILGMGNDGHTASLFPGAKQLEAATNQGLDTLCVAVSPPEASFERMSMTLNTILDSRQIFLHITGHDKKEILDKALQEGPAKDMPIRYVLRQDKTPVVVYWAP